MDASTTIAALQEGVPGAQIEAAASSDLQPTLYVAPGDLPAVARALREHPALRFDFLAELTAIDFWPREPRFEVVYLLVSIERRARLRMKVRLGGDQARLATVTGLWPAANWLEREVWDLFGIEFDGHPDPRRLLMPDDWNGHPLRKDYPVQIKMPPTTGEPLQVTEEQFRQSLEKDRLSRQ
jgi:NADH-quinone oxidoreductase subunit C